MQDSTLLEYLACRAYGAARRRVKQRPERIATLGSEERRTVERADRLETFLTTPFYVAEDFTGVKGVTVSLEDTLSGVETILKGECDAMPVDDLRFIGALPS